MIHLREVDQSNFNECMDLKRESNHFVGGPEYVLANAYIYRDDSLAYAICNDETIIGLVIIRDFPTEKWPYSFTEFFIADDFQQKGYGKQAVETIINKFKSEKKSPFVELQVHEANVHAIKIYKSCGFIETGCAKWDNHFLVMQLYLD